MKALLARGVDPNTVDPNGDPVLYMAARAGNAATVDVLLATKVNVDARNRFGDTPLMGAALEGHLDIVRKLRARGAAVDFKGWTPLIYAATGGRDDIVAFLLDQGANVNAESPNGTTALMMAVREGKGSTVELLIKRGADVNHRNENNISALDWAKRGNESRDGTAVASRGRARLARLGRALPAGILGVRDERPRELDTVAFGQRRRCCDTLAEYRVAELARVELVAIEDSRSGDSVGDDC